MKVCFFLQRRFAYIGHHLAGWLKEKYGVNDFCGYVYLRWSYNFLKEQADINYTSLLLDEDVHKKYLTEPLDLKYLAYLEKEFGIPNLWPYITLDRVVMYNQLVREYPYDTPIYTHEEMMRIFQVKARAILNFLEKEKPRAIVFPNIGGIGALFMYQAAKKMGIKPLVLLPACTKDRFVLSEKYDYFTGVEEIFNNSDKKPSAESFRQATDFINEFRNKPASYLPDATAAFKKANRRAQLKFLSPRNLLQRIGWFIKMVGLYLRDRKFKDYSDTLHPWYYLVDRVKRKFRNLIGASDLYDAFTPEEDFAFFPLHMEPELATLLQAPFYANQLNLVRQIARSLPLHFKLYVKEHPFMAEYRPRRYYKELKKIPNVKLINPGIPSSQIIPKAKLITTITSTAGWEAVMLKKPVIVFGDQFYNALSTIKKCLEIEKLPYMVRDCLANHKHNEDELLRFIASIYEDSIPLNLHYLWEQEQDEDKKKRGLEELADYLAKKIGISAIKAVSK